MKIYFAGSIRGGRDDQEIYKNIIEVLQNFGEVLTEHVGKKEVNSEGEPGLGDEEIYERDKEWINEADVIVAEVTTPSLGVGYEIGYAESLQKKVICLWREVEGKRVSAMLRGNKNVTILKYTEVSDVENLLKGNI